MENSIDLTKPEWQPPSPIAVAGPPKGFELANPWARLIANIIDGLIIGTIAGIISLPFISDEKSNGDKRIVQLIGIIIGAFYYTFQDTSTKQATIGKRAFKLIVVDDFGNPIDKERAIKRFLCRLIPTFGIGLALCLFRDDKRCLHDIVSDTYVLKVM